MSNNLATVMNLFKDPPQPKTYFKLKLLQKPTPPKHSDHRP